MLKDNCNWRGLMLTVPLILLVGCAPVSPNSDANWQTVKPAAYPPLPKQAQQEPLPPFCLPTCSANLSDAMKSWQRMLTEQEHKG